jgi:hypothetical protein
MNAHVRVDPGFPARLDRSERRKAGNAARKSALIGDLNGLATVRPTGSVALCDS